MRHRASVVLVEESRVLLIKRIHKGRTYFVFPGGGIEPGETPAEAAVREAFEELGIHVRLVKNVDMLEFAGTHHVFKAEIESGIVGSAKGEEYANPKRGSYEPMFVPLYDLHLLPVFPKEIAEKVKMIGEQ